MLHALDVVRKQVGGHNFSSTDFFVIELVESELYMAIAHPLQ